MIVTPTLDPSALRPRPEVMSIGLFGRNRAVLGRAARVVRAAANLEWVAFGDDPAQLRSQLAETTRLLLCDGADLALVLDWMSQGFPRARVVAFSHDPAALIGAAERDDRVVSVLGWPAFQSMPRPWELALATRTILSADSEATTLGDVLTGVPVAAEFRPQTHTERAATVDQIAALAERTGAGERVSTQIAAVAHELIINASYDAPVDAAGEPTYIHDRRAPITARGREVPLVQFATDGNLVVVQVVDRYGRLTRDHVLASIRRGQAAGTAPACEVVDSSSGGAGLGIWQVYASSAVTIVDVLPGYRTAVTAVFDIDLHARDARTLPPSLHLFDRGRLG